MNEWVTGELSSVDFSDKRLDKRGCELFWIGSEASLEPVCLRPARDGMRHIVFSTMEK